MTKLKLRSKEIGSPEYLKKLQDIKKEASKQKLSNKLKNSHAASE